MFRELSRTISSAPSLKELLKVLAQRTAAHCGTEVCSIFLWDPSGDQVVTMTSQTASGEEIDLHPAQPKAPGRLMVDDMPLLAATAERRSPIVLDNPVASPLVPPRWVEVYHVKSLISVPLMWQNSVIGALVLHRIGATKGFTDSQIHLASNIASQVAMAIENARLVQATQARLRESETLLAVSQSVSSTLDLKETLQRVAREAALAAGADSSGAYLLDPREGVIRPFASQNLPDWVSEPFQRNPFSVKAFPLVQEAFDKRVPVYSSDVPADPRCAHPAIRRLAFKSCLIAPMIAKEKFIGVLFLVWWEKSHTFTSDQVRLMEGVARQAAMAIDNASAYHEIEKLNISLEDKIAKRTRELSEINTALEESHRRLQELDRVKSDFLLNISHELRTPLTAIKGSVDNMLDEITGPLSELQRRYLMRVKVNADRLVRLINDLLDLARIEEGRVQVTPTFFSLAGLASELLETLRPVAAEKGLELSLAEGQDPLIVHADRDKAGQVLMNLLGNAIKFTPSGGSVNVELAGDEDAFARVQICDTGDGIPPEQLPRIFDKFYQVQLGIQAKAVGTGLGLSIAKGLVELQGGRIWAESQLGQGSTFCFTLPRRPLAELRGAAVSGDARSDR
ncbi:MAG: GAF domain-containing protein [candidate division NC10 bacterium]|nr:GAF domain-containing protein [candidate division NC10 bacterium]